MVTAFTWALVGMHRIDKSVDVGALVRLGLRMNYAFFGRSIVKTYACLGSIDQR